MCRKIEIFTDGSCIKNPGPGGYSAILRYREHVKELSAGYRLTTNNRMELLAIIIALESLKSPYKITLNTDSQYVYQGINQWINIWKQCSWKTSRKKLVKNVDLWKRLNLAIHYHQLQWNWVKSHDGHIENERCDQLAREAAKNAIFEDIGYLSHLK